MTLTHALIEQHREALRRFLEDDTELLIAILDPERCVVAHNTAMGQVLADARADLSGHRLQELFSTDVELPPKGESWRIQLRPAGETAQRPLKGLVISDGGGYVLFLRPPGRGGESVLREMASLNQQLNDANRKLQQERRRLREAKERIERLARTDSLTGLANRRVHDDEMERAISSARRHEENLSVTMADLDKFKDINDEYGHDVGDRVLEAFAQLLQESCRAEDVPIRFGGEEFLIIMPHTDARAGRSMAERVRREWEQTRVPGVDRPTTVSLGVAQWRPGEDQDDVVRRADDALYEAKAAGRNRVRVAGQ